MVFHRISHSNPINQVWAMKSRYPQFKAKCKDIFNIEFIGDLKVSEEFPIYTVSITYRGSLDPRVKVIHPQIVENAPHIYRESKTLCLYHPHNYHWTSDKLIAKDIVALTAAWIYFYEVWLQTGIWYGPEVAHDIPDIQP